jgi:hypothetical protein
MRIKQAVVQPALFYLLREYRSLRGAVLGSFIILPLVLVHFRHPHTEKCPHIPIEIGAGGRGR